jgi:hypothetical protein
VRRLGHHVSVASSTRGQLALVSCALVVLAGLGSCGGAASARPSSWKPFCSQLSVIKKTSETGGWNNGPSDPYGLKKFATYYANLKRVSPSSSMVALLSAARPVLAYPLNPRATNTSRAAVRSMEPIVMKQCRLAVGDVFKVPVD